jgi:hypothetical protein
MVISKKLTTQSQKPESLFLREKKNRKAAFEKKTKKTSFFKLKV